VHILVAEVIGAKVVVIGAKVTVIGNIVGVGFVPEIPFFFLNVLICSLESRS